MEMLFCNFCHGCGIQGPHDHSLRDFSKKGNPIICQKLLNTKCEDCNEMGHTKMYCPKKNQKKNQFLGNNHKNDIVIYIKPSQIDYPEKIEKVEKVEKIEKNEKNEKNEKIPNADNISSLTSQLSGMDIKLSSKSSWAGIVRSGGIKKRQSVLTKTQKIEQFRILLNNKNNPFLPQLDGWDNNGRNSVKWFD